MGESGLLLEWQMQSTQLDPTPWEWHRDGPDAEDCFPHPPLPN